MGNCGLRGAVSSSSEVVRVVTWSGGVMELPAPVTADAVAASFPGHAVFRSREPESPPVASSDDLLPGPQPYYLLPLGVPTATAASDWATPYRVSCEGRRAQVEQVVRPRYGVWKVKLVISPEQLSEILSQDSRTEALIDSVRTVAKCRGGGAASSVASSDQWSVSSSG